MSARSEEVASAKNPSSRKLRRRTPRPARLDARKESARQINAGEVDSREVAVRQISIRPKEEATSGVPARWHQGSPRDPPRAHTREIDPREGDAAEISSGEVSSWPSEVSTTHRPVCRQTRRAVDNASGSNAAEIIVGQVQPREVRPREVRPGQIDRRSEERVIGEGRTGRHLKMALQACEIATSSRPFSSKVRIKGGEVDARKVNTGANQVPLPE